MIVSAKSEEADVVAGLELGADDYLQKPFSPRILAARAKALLRRGRAGRESGHRVEAGRLSIDGDSREARAGGRLLDLTAGEFDLLALLAGSPGRVFTRELVIASIKGPDYPVTDRSVDVQVLSLRKKLGPDGALVETVRGVGYRLRRSDG